MTATELESIAPSDLFPDGRTIYYEGEDPPELFREKLKHDYGYDVGPKPQSGFHCPPKILDAIYLAPGPYGWMGS